MATREIKIDYLSRVEGEGALFVNVRDGRVSDVKLNIFEPPRFFEGFLIGRGFQEVPDITARICGICPVAYQMSSVHALEKALGWEITPEIRALRRLLYCAEWIESHALHMYLLNAPDFLGYDSGITMAKDHREVVERGLRMKKQGNRLLEILGGRAIHPVSVCVGGFYRAPRREELAALLDDFRWGLEASLATVKFVSSFSFPDFAPDYEFVALRHASEYPMNEGRIVSSRGLDVAPDNFEYHFGEEHVAHSNALQGRRLEGGSYMVGPLARLNLNKDRLTPLAAQALQDCGLAFPNRNPFVSIVARAIETVLAYEEAIRLIENYQEPSPPRIEGAPRAGEGSAATEAPRGILYHRYSIARDGLVRFARIIPPTAQNLRRMEDDLREYVPGILDLPEDKATLQCETLIRAYDPCISCATHFLKLHVHHEN
jgi:coenzyme F420-reducing hydrogenase alpha subunit